MGKSHCAAPGCGRFVGKGMVQCRNHPQPGPDDDLRFELAALRGVLGEVLDAETDEPRDKATVAARIVSVIVQLVKAQYAMGEAGAASFLETITPILKDLDGEQRGTAGRKEGSLP